MSTRCRRHSTGPAAWLLLLVLLVAAGAPAAGGDYRVETVAEGLEHPWSLAFLPDGRMLVTERAGRLRIIDDNGLVGEPVSGVPAAYVASQGGLFEVLPHPDFDANGRIYLSLAHGDADGNTTRVVRGRLSGNRLEEVETVFSARPERATPVHYGGRMLFLPDRTLLVTLGDGYDYRDAAQDPGNHLGTIVRIHDDGSVPADNPLVDNPDARPEVYSYGHRNVQGIVRDPDTGRIWSNEHGPRGGDEVNLIRAGGNYGWPIATHGVDYTGAIISPYRHVDGTIAPVHVWTPAIAPAGLMFYTGEAFPEWRGSLFNAGLVSRDVRRLVLEGTRVVAEEGLFAEAGARIRDVRAGPDGTIYLLTDEADGRVLRIVP